MKFNLFFFVTLVIVGCNTKQKVVSEMSFNDQDYILFDSVKNRFGKISSYVYKNKKDTSFLRITNQWENGKIRASGFYKKGSKYGPMQFFDTLGNITFTGFFLENKETGISLLYEGGKINKMTIYCNGNEKLIDPQNNEQILKLLCN
ncbi:hypothetical protein IQ13_0895 [Lacibacter cauensis]|uniref:MORN repeat protein n=1 Tax=Lacibacter cauensis TaxID=510947 RepID=A0A562SYJ6_9BACT|nr:hypothetical protein [Lacibacter cauensis]TWI85730.1 hypothetical protein IQ13_0895 [Lacibacter cauensis]